MLPPAFEVGSGSLLHLCSHSASELERAQGWLACPVPGCPQSHGCLGGFVPSCCRVVTFGRLLSLAATSFPDRLLGFLLPKLESSNEKTRVGTLTVLRQIINSARKWGRQAGY